VTDEVWKAVQTFKLAPRELKDVLVYGFKRSFFPGPYHVKREYVRQVLDTMEEQFLQAGMDVRAGRQAD